MLLTEREQRVLNQSGQYLIVYNFILSGKSYFIFIKKT